MNPQVFDLIVVGDGLGARSLLYFLKEATGTILTINSPQLFPPASQAAGAVVSLFGARKGVSPLGDLVVESFQEFERFVDTHSPQGVARVGEDYLVHPPTYLKFLRVETSQQMCATVTSYQVENHLVGVELLGGGPKIWGRNLVLACGAGGTLLNLPGRPVYGGYLGGAQDLGDESFLVQGPGGLNFLYWAPGREFSVGASTQKKGGWHCPPEELLGQWKDFAQAHVGPIDWTRAYWRAGVRARGPGRLPHGGPLHKGPVWALGNLYKNGVGFSLLKARDLALGGLGKNLLGL